MKFPRLGSLPNLTPAVAGFVLFFALGATAFVTLQRSNLRQPIAFNHAKHVENGVGCTDCHAGVETQAKATLPAIDTCLNCHQTALSSSAEEAKIRTAAAAGKELAWVQVTQLAPHVFFSHRRHVSVAHLACAECHGPMEKITAPPQRPWRVLNMDACIGCHRQHGVNADCNDCHH
jgi:hypothetical protein